MTDKIVRGYCSGLNKESACHKGCPLKALEKKLDFWKNQLVIVKKECFDHTNTYINELKERVEEIYKSVHGITPDQADNLQNQIDKLAKYILEYFPGKIIDEEACLTAIGIMEEFRNK